MHPLSFIRKPPPTFALHTHCDRRFLPPEFEYRINLRRMLDTIQAITFSRILGTNHTIGRLLWRNKAEGEGRVAQDIGIPSRQSSVEGYLYKVHGMVLQTIVLEALKGLRIVFVGVVRA
jgi:hypothetical protein